MWAGALAIVGKVAAFFGLSQLRVWFTIAAVVGATFFLTSVYLAGRSSVQRADEIRNLKEQNAALERLISATHKEQKAEAAAKAEQEQKVRELEAYVDTLSDRNAECLSADDVDKLRSVIGR